MLPLGSFFTCMCRSDSSKNSARPSADLCSFSVQMFPLCYSALRIPARLALELSTPFLQLSETTRLLLAFPCTVTGDPQVISGSNLRAHLNRFPSLRDLCHGLTDVHYLKTVVYIPCFSVVSDGMVNSISVTLSWPEAEVLLPL